jgi:cell division protein FtsB
MLASSVLGLALTGLLVFGGTSLVRTWQMQREVEALEREIQRLRTEARELSDTVDRLRDDPTFIEQIAREGLGLVKPGEKVLKFPSEKR